MIKEDFDNKNNANASENNQKVNKFNFGKVMLSILLVGLIIFVVVISISGCSSDPNNASLRLVVPTDIKSFTPTTFNLFLSDKVDFKQTDEIKWFINDKNVKTAKATDEDAYSLTYTFEEATTAKLKVETNNYKNLIVSNDVIVTKPTLVLKAKDITKIYGEKTPIFEYETSGLLPKDDLEDLNINPLLTTDATQFSAIGTYDIVFAPINNSKYNIQLVNAKTTILPKNLLIRLETFHKVYDGTKILNTQVLFDKINNDDVNVKYESITFNDKNVSRIKPLTLNNVELIGKDSKNYNLAYEPFFGDILPRILTIKGIKANDKMYDGNTNVTFADAGYLENIIDNDIVGIGDIEAKFQKADSGENIKVIIEFINLVGNDSRNYEADLTLDIKATIKGTNRFLDFSPKTLPSN